MAVHGFTWTTGLVGLLNLLVGGLLVQIIRTRPALKKIDAYREANLLQERAAEMDAMRARIEKLESKLETREREHAADRAIDRHRINNVTSCLEALLFMLETSPAPEKVAEAVAKIREMRARQAEAEAIEKATIHAGKISGRLGEDQ